MQKIEVALKELVFRAYPQYRKTRTLILCSLTFYMDVIMRLKTENMEMCQCFQYYRTYRQDGAGSIKYDKKLKAPSKCATLQLLNSYLFSSQEVNKLTTNNSNIQEINSGTPPVSPLQILKLTSDMIPSGKDKEKL